MSWTGTPSWQISCVFLILIVSSSSSLGRGSGGRRAVTRDVPLAVALVADLTVARLGAVLGDVAKLTAVVALALCVRVKRDESRDEARERRVRTRGKRTTKEGKRRVR